MDILETFKADVGEARGKLARIELIAAAAGIKSKTLRNIIYIRSNPRYDTIKKLTAYYEKKNATAQP